MDVTPFHPMKLLRHADRVEAMLRGEVVYPVSVEIDLSNVCNHGCPWCSFNGFRQENWVSFTDERIFSLLSELRSVGVKSITFTGGGEPLVHKRAADIFTKCYALGMQFGVVTNGRRMEGATAEAIATLATFVRVSLDAGSAQTHQLLHATAMPEYGRILKHMAHVRGLAHQAGRPLTIGASMCIFDVNRHEIGEAARRVRDTGANYLEVRPVFPTEWRGGGFGNPLTDEYVEEAKANLAAAQDAYDTPTFKVIGMISRFNQVADTRKPYTKCQTGPLTTVINADGYIYHCCQQRGMPNFRAGSVLQQSFKEVWWNAHHQQMVAGIDVTKCPPCRYDGFNTLIAEAFERDGMHGDFL